MIPRQRTGRLHPKAVRPTKEMPSSTWLTGKCEMWVRPPTSGARLRPSTTPANGCGALAQIFGESALQAALPLLAALGTDLSSRVFAAAWRPVRCETDAHAACWRPAGARPIERSAKCLGHASHGVPVLAASLSAAVTVSEEATCFIGPEYRPPFENETLLFS